jgi:hypothetical protein
MHNSSNSTRSRSFVWASVFDLVNTCHIMLKQLHRKSSGVHRQANRCTHYMRMCKSEALRSTLVAASHCLVCIILQAQSVSNNFHTLDQICILAVMYQNMIHSNQHSHLVFCESDRYAPLHFCSKGDLKNNNDDRRNTGYFLNRGMCTFQMMTQLLHSSIHHTTQTTSCVNPLAQVNYR